MCTYICMYNTYMGDNARNKCQLERNMCQHLVDAMVIYGHMVSLQTGYRWLKYSLFEKEQIVVNRAKSNISHYWLGIPSSPFILS